MKRLLLAGLLLLGACKETKYVAGPTQSEKAVIEDVIFSPRRHGSDVAVGVTTGGSLSVAPVDITLPEKKTIVIRCAHGRFTLESDHNTQNGDMAKTLFHQVDKGQQVTLTYREVFEVEVDGDKELSRKFVKYETLSVQ